MNDEVKVEVEKSAVEKFIEDENKFNSNAKLPDPVTPPAKDTENKEEAKSDSGDAEKQPEEIIKAERKEEEQIDPVVDKRLKDKDRYITKLQENIREIKARIEKRDKLINRFDDAIERDENGDPIDWNFDKAAKKASDNTEPPLPTEDDSVIEALKKQRAHDKWEDRQEKIKEEQEKRRKEDLTKAEQAKLEAETARIEAINESNDLAVEMFPEFDDPNSELRKKAVEIYHSNPKFKYRTDYNLLCACQAAEELGIKPISKQTENNSKKEVKKEVRVVPKPSLMTLGRSGTGISSDNPAMNKINNFIENEKKFRVR